MIDHRSQAGQAAGQGLLAVLRVKELRIGQPWFDHALIAFDDARRIGNRHVRHNQKAIAQRTVVIKQREIALIGLHRQDQALGRHFKIARLELTDINGRPLDNGRDFIAQGLHFGTGAKLQGLLASCCTQGRIDTGAPGFERGHHMRAFQRRFIVEGRGNADRSAGKKAMAFGNAIGLQAEDGSRHNLVAMQHHQAMRGAGEADRGLTVGQLVAHQARGGVVYCCRPCPYASA